MFTFLKYCNILAALFIRYVIVFLNGFVHFECETGIQTLLPLIRQAKGRVVTITSGLGTFIYVQYDVQ
jgi:hypothetical protein